MFHDIDNAPTEDGQDVQGKENEKEEEETIVPTADAIVDPGTMMVEGFHAGVA